MRQCVVKGCDSVVGKTPMYYFPKGELQGMLWKDAVWPHIKIRVKVSLKNSKEEWDKYTYARICNKHFVNGEKSPFPGKDGYIPTLFPDTRPKAGMTDKEFAHRAEMISMLSDAFQETKRGRPRSANSRLNIGIAEKPGENSIDLSLCSSDRAQHSEESGDVSLSVDERTGDKADVNPKPTCLPFHYYQGTGKGGRPPSAKSRLGAALLVAKRSAQQTKGTAQLQIDASAAGSSSTTAETFDDHDYVHHVQPDKPTKRSRRHSEEEDDAYFKSYADISIHEDMIRDTVRTNTYRMAILKSVKKIAGKVVLDIGAGTGILSCFCAQAGAKKVYAIEASDMADQAKKVVESNGFGNKIQIIHGKVEEVSVPERIDVIVSEWMGHFLLYESMLNSVIFARIKWLKVGGLILPGLATLYLAPITNEEIYKDRIDFWDEPKQKYGVDMSCLKPYAKKCVFSQVQLEEIIGSDLIADSCQIAKININLATPQDIKTVMGKFHFKCFGSLPLCGFVSWFTVTFNIPGSLSSPLVMSTAPNKHTTHWKQTVMYLDEPIPVEQDTEISGTIVLTPGKVHKRCLDVALTFQVHDTAYIKKYSMGPTDTSTAS